MFDKSRMRCSRQVSEVRKGLEEREGNADKQAKPQSASMGGGALDSHLRDVKKEEENRRMREAFGLGDDFVSGEAFDEEAQERRKEARKR